VNHVHLYKVFLGRCRSVQVDVISNTYDVIKSYRWFVADLWPKEISKDLLRFGFLIFLVIRRQVCPLIFGGFVLVGRVVFFLGIYELIKL
jgi:hypothetical protein